MKRLLFILIVLSFSLSAVANDDFKIPVGQPIGGVLKSKKDGSLLAIACEKRDEKTNECESYDLIIQNKSIGDTEYRWMATFEKPKKLAKGVFKEETARTRGFVKSAWITGTGLTLLTCVWPGQRSALGCALIPVGVAFDIVKAPLVAVGTVLTIPGLIFHKIRAKRLTKFLLNPKKKGKVKRVRDKTYDSFIYGS